LVVGDFKLAWTQGNFTNLMRSSVLIAVCVVPLAVILATLAACGLEVLKVWGNRAMSAGFLLGLTLPVELVVVALYYNLQQVGLTNTYLGIILAEVALFMPFGVYWMQSHFSGLPVSSSRLRGSTVRAISPYCCWCW
jgi:raffinose/stachyose/melibiose transport system permease protein